MIITLIIIGVVIVAFVCLNIAHRTSNDLVFGIGIVLALFGLFGVLFAGSAIIDVNVNKDIYYQNTIYEKEMLEYRIDNMEDNIVGNEMLYNDIVEFNNSLRGVKKWANSLWTNWFFNEDIATIDYIELDGR